MGSGVKQPIKNIENAEDVYRCESDDSWSDDEDSSSSDTFFKTVHAISSHKKYAVVKTKGELELDDLPLIEELAISVEENEMVLVGKVYAIVEKLVVVHALKDMKPLDLDSVLFLSHNQPLGRVFDVFGPVSEPFYSVRFNSAHHISEKGVKVGAEVFFAPEKSDITSYVFVDELQIQRGSDASWKHNNEPPEECLDYSDDEAESMAKRKRIAKNRNRQFSDCSDVPKRLSLAGDSPQFHYIPPPRRPRRNNFQTATVRTSRPNPFQSPSPSVHSGMASTRIKSSSGTYTPNQTCLSYTSPQMLSQHQNILYRPSSQVVLSPYPQPYIFGQVTVSSPLSPALRAPPPPHPSPVMNNIPTLIPVSHFPPATPQNYFNQSFQRSSSPGSHIQHFPPATPQNYFNQSFQRSSSPGSHIRHFPPDPWLPNRSPTSASIGNRSMQT